MHDKAVLAPLIIGSVLADHTPFKRLPAGRRQSFRKRKVWWTGWRSRAGGKDKGEGGRKGSFEFHEQQPTGASRKGKPPFMTPLMPNKRKTLPD
jgi:hypothetical protein